MSDKDQESNASAATVEPHRWEDAYKKGKDALPWDTGAAAPELVRYLESSTMPKQILEIGCGTGSNAIWMAERGASVLATEISPTAIELAKKKIENNKSLKLEFRLADIIESSPVKEGTIDFVFDRGVYHVMPDDDSREIFIDRVAGALKNGGFWLCIAGSADEDRPENAGGPPQLQASDLVNLAQKHFELFHLKRIISSGPYGNEIVMWEALYRKRAPKR
ncbi:MAG TPA: class I SAM-dependent methyltransferase [Oculatellaceae cyanobacterium]